MTVDLVADLLPAGVSPWVALVLVVVSFIASFITAAAGLGGGGLMLAVLASTLPPVAVIPIHGVIQLGSNSGRAFILRPWVNRPVVGFFVIGALAGAAAGGKLYIGLPQEVIKLVLGLFILYTVWGPGFRRMLIPTRAYVGVGAATTFLTMFVGGTGPFVAAFISPDRFGKEETVATQATCMTLQHGLKVLVFGLLGFAFGPWIALLAVMIGFGFLGTLAGRAALARLPERGFRIAFRTVLTLFALRLLWGAGADLIVG